MSKKSFDAVEMKRTCQAKVQADLAGLTDSEILARFAKIEKQMRQRQAAARKARDLKTA